jgi:membrane-associated protease RseP (regulator of RpoE activity)
MPVWLQIVAYVLAILTIVLVHESGHFFTAKAFGIKVSEFFVGFGPRLWSMRRGETEYGVKAFPFGGYVRIAGMNPFEEVPPEELPRTFQAKPIWQRAIVIATGPVTHFVIAVVLFAIFYVAIGTPTRFRPEIDSVSEKLNGAPSPALRAGLKPGDRVLAVDSLTFPPTEDANREINALTGYTRSHPGKIMKLVIDRGGKTLALHVTPVVATFGGKRGAYIGVGVDAAVLERDRVDPFTAIGRGVTDTGTTIWLVVQRLGDVFGPSGLKRIAQQLVGSTQRGAGDVQSVVGAGRTLVQAASAFGFWTAFLQLLVSFNVFIGILNLVPLPPLDGGHLAVLVYEKIRRRRPDARKLIPLTAVVAAFMILFAISITYLDIVSPLPNQFR